MPNIVEQLQGLDFTAIDDALGRVRIAVSAEGGVDLSGIDPSVLLGDAAPAIEAVRALDGSTESLTDVARVALRELSEIATLPEFEEVQELLEGIEALASLIQELVGVLTSDDGAIVDRLLTQVGGSLDLGGFVADIAGRATETLRVDVPEPLEAAFGQLTRLGSGVSNPDDLANVVMGAIGGLDFEAVRRLGSGLSESVEIVAHAGNDGPIAAAFARAEAEIETVIALSAFAEAGGSDLDDFIASLSALAATLDTIAGETLPGFVDGFTTDLRTCRNRLTEADPMAGLEDLLGQIPRPGIEPIDTLVQPLRELAGALDTVTAETMATALDATREEITSFARVGEIAALLDGIDEAQRRVVELIRELPAEELRDSIVGSLRDVQREILSFQGFGFLDQALMPIRQLAAELAAIDTSAVTDAIQEIVDGINEVFADFPIDDLRDAVEGVLEPLAGILDEAGPALEEIAAQLEGLVAEVDAIDFDAAGAEVVESLAEIRAQVTDALDTDAVPDALQAIIAGAAATLKQMDLAVELSDPFGDAVARIDVEGFLEPVTEVWEQLGAALERATPAALISELDPPFEELLERLDQVSLQPLTDALGALFGDLLGVLRRADPRELLAPLDAEFDQIVESVRGVLDPAPLFAPVRSAYDSAHAELQSIDLEAAIQELLGGIADTPGAIRDTVQSQVAAGAGDSGQLVPAPDDLPFRFGDVLRPLAALLAEIRSRLHGLSDGAAAEGFGLLADATRELRSLLEPAAGFSVRMSDHLDERRAWYDASVAGPMARLRARLAGVDEVLASLELDAEGGARVDAATGGVTLSGRVQVDVSVSVAASESVAQTRQAADPPGLGRSVRLLVRELDRLLPSALLEDSIDPRAALSEFIDALFDPFDPAPIVVELDEIGEQIMAKLGEFVDELSLGLVALLDDMISGLQPLAPTSVAARLQALVDAVVAEFEALDPVVIEDETRKVVEATVGLLQLYSPGRMAEELGAAFDEAIGVVEALDPDTLLGDLDPFADLRAELAALRPSEILAPLVDATASLTASLEVIASIDLDIVGELFDEMEAAFGVVLDGVEREWKALLDELEGLGGGASVSAGVAA